MYNPLDKTPLAHKPDHYLGALGETAEEIFKSGWPTRMLAWELACEVGYRQNDAAKRAIWDAHTGDDEHHPWKWRVAVCNALAELHITASVINRRKS